MFAYDCPNSIEPYVRADGEIHRCVAEDIDELIEFMDLFHRETGVDQDWRVSGEAGFGYILWRVVGGELYTEGILIKNILKYFLTDWVFRIYTDHII